jgi:D-3-phosphoglycerate dehydrogenase
MSSPASRPKVLLTNASVPTGENIIREVADIVLAPDAKPDTLRAMVGDCDVLVVRAKLPDDLFERPNRLKGVVRHGAGVDLIPMDSATKLGIPVANVPGVNAQTVAEYVITTMLMLARATHRMDALVRTKGWDIARVLSDEGVELAGKTVGIVGVGAIGKIVTRICHHGFGMNIIGFQRNLDQLPKEVKGVSLDELFAQSDFVVLACPLTPETKGLASSARIASMRKNAVLVNVSRGPVVDEAAITQALVHRRIRGAALDVFDKQPLTVDHPLMALDNVVLTPHQAGLTVEAVERTSRGAAEETVRLLKGEKPVNLVNPEVWDRRAHR